MRNDAVKKIALGGLMAAVAVVIMCLGGMIPLATFICPVLCILLCGTVFRFCGKRITWAWYCCVALLALLLGPDKEAAAIFVLLGYYPILKPWLESRKIGVVLKLVYFNTGILLLYAIMIYVLGMEQIMDAYMELGYIGLGIMLVLGNVTFFLVDRLLTVFSKKGKRNGR